MDGGDATVNEMAKSFKEMSIVFREFFLHLKLKLYLCDLKIWGWKQKEAT